MGNIPPIIISPGAVTAWPLVPCCSDAHPTCRRVKKSATWMWIHRKICAMLRVLLGGLSFPSSTFLVAHLCNYMPAAERYSPFSVSSVEKALPFPPYGFAILKFFPEAWPTSLWVVAWWVTLNLEAATTISCCGVSNTTQFSRHGKMFGFFFHACLRICQIFKMVNAVYYSSTFFFLVQSQHPKTLYKIVIERLWGKSYIFIFLKSQFFNPSYHL